MIAGLPWESWLLLGVAVGLGLGIEIAFFRAHRKERKGRGGAGGSGPAASTEAGDPSPAGGDAP